ncbi:MAG: ATP-binding protein [Candidatus Kerfeldbacteria bacterium]|nr:ATP-binding protein [Candidatus Kerfeldbacteria bacterium]
MIIDEIQHLPTLFPLLRALIDQQRQPGQFLILGSASPHLLRQASESLAGRIIYHELTPLTLAECTPHPYTWKQLWLRGGYPESMLANTDTISYQWRQSFIRNYIERDIPQLQAIRTSGAQLQRLLLMLAHSHGQLWNRSAIAKALGISMRTIQQFVDLFIDTFLVRQLQPYHVNLKKRLIKTPKLYFRDSGIIHTLLNIQTLDQLHNHPAVGALWEGFAIEQLLNILPSTWQYYFYRTHTGVEVDLLLISPTHQHILVEIKYTLSPTLSRGFWEAYQDLYCHKAYILYPGTEHYNLAKHVTVLPIAAISTVA